MCALYSLLLILLYLLFLWLLDLHVYTERDPQSIKLLQDTFICVSL